MFYDDDWSSHMVSKRRMDAGSSRARALMSATDDDLTPDPGDLDADGSIDPEPTESTTDLDEEMRVVEAALQGASTRSVSIYRHDVAFHVLNVREELQAHSLAKVSQDTPAYNIALKTAYFALACDSIDSMPFHVKIASDGSDAAERWQIALRYHRQFIARFFDEYAAARDEATEALDALEK